MKKSYLIRSTAVKGRYNLGHSHRPNKRFDEFKTHNLNVELIGMMDFPKRVLHKTFSQYKTVGDWFDFPPVLAETVEKMFLAYTDSKEERKVNKPSPTVATTYPKWFSGSSVTQSRPVNEWFVDNSGFKFKLSIDKQTIMVDEHRLIFSAALCRRKVRQYENRLAKARLGDPKAGIPATSEMNIAKFKRALEILAEVNQS